MPQRETIRVTGYRELMRALAKGPRDTRLAVRGELRDTARQVRDDSERLFAPYDDRSSRGYRVRVRQREVAVEQSLRKTTGLHPEFGEKQMVKALIPALKKNGPRLERDIRHAVERIAARINAS